MIRLIPILILVGCVSVPAHHPVPVATNDGHRAPTTQPSDSVLLSSFAHQVAIASTADPVPIIGFYGTVPPSSGRTNLLILFHPLYEGLGRTTEIKLSIFRNTSPPRQLSKTVGVEPLIQWNGLDVLPGDTVRVEWQEGMLVYPCIDGVEICGPMMSAVDNISNAPTTVPMVYRISEE